jgi:hypothetical protein
MSDVPRLQADQAGGTRDYHLKHRYRMTPE